MEHLEFDDSSEELADALKSSHTLTLHAIDTRNYQIATLMEENTFSDLHPNPDDRNKPDYETIGHSFRLPNVYGLPPRDSPYYREFAGADFNGVSPVECVSVYGTIALDKDKDDDGEIAFLSLRDIYICFDQETLTETYEIYSFLTALMREKCVS